MPFKKRLTSPIIGREVNFGSSTGTGDAPICGPAGVDILSSGWRARMINVNLSSSFCQLSGSKNKTPPSKIRAFHLRCMSYSSSKVRGSLAVKLRSSASNIHPWYFYLSVISCVTQGYEPHTYRNMISPIGNQDNFGAEDHCL